jgi:hypothetical protein
MISRKLVTVVRLPFATKALMVEALVLLAFARLAVLFLPFRWVAKLLGRQAAETGLQHDPQNALVIERVCWMLPTVARNVPWESKCLDQALAAKVMLRRRGIATTVYFGVQHDDHGRLAAHAWLRSGTRYVTGGASRNQFAIINTFADTST